jgi:Spy/CpxP family protein refolding chaperone
MRAMNLTKITSLGLCPLFIAALAVGGCEDKKDDTTTTAASASAAPSAKAAPSASAAPSAAASGSAAPESADAGMPGETPEEHQAQEDVTRHHAYTHGGMSKFFIMALATLGVEKEHEEKVEKIQKDFDKAAKPIRDANDKLILKLAEQIEAGKIEYAKFAKEDEAVAKAVPVVRNAMTEPVIQLHGALSPVERETLIDKVKANWAVWRDANTEDKKEEKKEEKSAKERGKDELKHEKGRVDRLAKQLTLTDDQVAKIKEELKKKAEGAEGPVEPKLGKDVEEKLEAFSKSFTSDKFDPKTLKEWEAVDPLLVAAGSKRLVRLIEVATPILTADQRKEWAKDMKERAKKDEEAEKKELSGEGEKKEEKKEKKEKK